MLDGQEDVFLCGGSFADSFFGSNALSRFTIWGGPKMAEGQSLPFAYVRADQVEEYLPGFRVVLERSLDDEWLYLVRKGVFQKGTFLPGAKEFVANSRELATELADETHISHKVLAFYASLVSDDSINQMAVGEELAHLSTVSAPTSQVEKPNRLLAIVKKDDNAKKEESETSLTDDQFFFRTLSSVVKRAPVASDR